MSKKTLSPLQSEVGPIVSSAHLVAPGAEELSEFEFGLIIANHAFERWMVRCMIAAGIADLSALDILVLHTINHRGREKRLADICLVLNVEDTHTVTYALKKLTRADLVSGRKSGKEKLFSTTKKGQKACQDYRQIRDACLVGSYGASELPKEKIGDLAEILRALSGLYDQASRAATSL
ncbi:winged helix DNA-binding protein [Pseudomonadota bacterium]